MLQLLPVEILLEVLHHVRFSVEYEGYYFDLESDEYWSWQELADQKVVLKLAATCRALRNLIGPLIWQDVHLDSSGRKLQGAPRGYRLFATPIRPGSKRGDLYYKSYFSAKKHKDLKKYLDSYTPVLTKQLNSSIEPALTYVKTLKISTDTKYPRDYRPYIGHNKIAFEAFFLAVGLVGPKTMPALEYLELKLFIDKSTEEAYKNLGQVLWTFRKKINLTLTAWEAYPDCGDEEKEFEPFPFLEHICRFGLLPFTVDLTLTKTDSTFCDSFSAATVLHLMNLQGLTINHIPYTYSVVTQLSTTFIPLICQDSRITYLDLKGVENELPSTFDWIPPTLSVLKCNTNFLMPATKNEEEQYRIFDNVTSLTLDISWIYTPSVREHYSLYFRNLTELHVSREGFSRCESSKLTYFDIIRRLLQSSRQNLVSLSIDYMFGPEYEFIAKHFGSVQNLQYDLVLQPKLDVVNTRFFSNVMTKWSTNLRRLSYRVDTFQFLNGIPVDSKYTYLDYNELRSRVLDHPNLQFNLVQFSSNMFTDKYEDNYHLGKNYILTEEIIFGGTFEESRDSKHFKLKDFCECPGPSLFSPLMSIYEDEPHSYCPIINLKMDFIKLRTLVCEVDSLEA